MKSNIFYYRMKTFIRMILWISKSYCCSSQVCQNGTIEHEKREEFDIPFSIPVKNVQRVILWISPTAVVVRCVKSNIWAWSLKAKNPSQDLSWSQAWSTKLSPGNCGWREEGDRPIYLALTSLLEKPWTFNCKFSFSDFGIKTDNMKD